MHEPGGYLDIPAISRAFVFHINLTHLAWKIGMDIGYPRLRGGRGMKLFRLSSPSDGSSNAP